MTPIAVCHGEYISTSMYQDCHNGLRYLVRKNVLREFTFVVTGRVVGAGVKRSIVQVAALLDTTSNLGGVDPNDL